MLKSVNWNIYEQAHIHTCMQTNTVLHFIVHVSHRIQRNTRLTASPNHTIQNEFGCVVNTRWIVLYSQTAVPYHTTHTNTETYWNVHTYENRVLKRSSHLTRGTVLFLHIHMCHSSCLTHTYTLCAHLLVRLFVCYFTQSFVLFRSVVCAFICLANL